MAIATLGKLNLEEPPPIWGSRRSVDCFEKLEQIGEGTYGEVYKARDIETGEIVALKKIHMDGETEGIPVTAIREIKILSKLRHENIIVLKEVVTSSGREQDDEVKKQGYSLRSSAKARSCGGSAYGIYMVFEYMDHDLTGLANRPGVKFTTPQIKWYMKQLLTGLHFCHVNQVLHRDIKGSNLLIDNEGNLKIADFGLARAFSQEETQNLTNEAVTLWYRAPELLLGAEKYGTAVDIWSVGCVFAELLNGKPIFPGRTEIDQLKKIFQLCGSPDETNWPGVSKMPLYNRFKSSKHTESHLIDTYKRKLCGHALELLDRMLVLDPSQRISAKDALDYDYFWSDPLPCDPKSLPSYESSHELQIKKRKKQTETMLMFLKEQEIVEDEEEEDFLYGDY